LASKNLGLRARCHNLLNGQLPQPPERFRYRLV
jgi:hypothetical protein